MLKKVLSIILSASCLLATASSLSVSADETIGDSNTNAQVFVLNEENNGQPPIYYGDNGITVCGEDLPNANNIWNLSNNGYTAYVSEFKHLVFTNYCFTLNNSGSIYVKFGGSDYMNYIYNKLDKKDYDYYFKITLYERTNILGLSSYSYVDSVTYTPLPTGQYIGKVFSGLEAGKKYFVSIEKKKDYIYIYNSNLTITINLL